MDIHDRSRAEVAAWARDMVLIRSTSRHFGNTTTSTVSAVEGEGARDIDPAG